MSRIAKARGVEARHSEQDWRKPNRIGRKERELKSRVSPSRGLGWPGFDERPYGLTRISHQLCPQPRANRCHSERSEAKSRNLSREGANVIEDTPLRELTPLKGASTSSA
jgi:hypothetical protein